MSIDSGVTRIPGSRAALPSLERELTGHRARNHVAVSVYPEYGYGYADESLVQRFPREALEAAAR